MLVFITTQLLAQGSAIVAENTVRIAPESEESFYYGFAKGDEIVFNMEVENDEFLSKVEIVELPTTQRFMECNTKRIRNKKIIASQTGIYKFRLINTAPVSQVCKLKIKRYPADKSMAGFNSSVFWRTVQDTTYTPIEEKYVVKSDTLIQEVYSGNPQLSSRYAITGNSNSQIIEFTLPENTMIWSFFIGTGIQGKEVFEKARTKFTLNAASIISKVPEYGPMAALALTGVSYFSNIQGDDNVKYWFLQDNKNVKLFLDHKSFLFYKRGDVITEAAQMRSPLKGRVYLAVLNDNSFEPIQLTIKVTAVELRQRWGTRIKQEIKVSNKQEPYLRN